ncbi:MAG: hypothetical protein GF421_01155 [Candidatus Aminicenantes bacterium]|nr:hypothetical protein [Candidatus Aminicenantes bacterium]
MNTKKRVFTAVLALALMAVSVQGTGTKTHFRQDLHGLLADFPAKNPETRNKQVSRLLELGKEGLVRLFMMLETTDSQEQIQVEYAVHGLAVECARLEREEDRFLVSKSLIQALDHLKKKESQVFVMSQLQLIGKQEIVRPLTPYLQDKTLCEPAARALLAVKTNKAEKAFLRSLRFASGDQRITCISALGELRSKKAVRKIKPFASSSDPKLRQASLYALANIGDPSCLGLLGKVRIRSSIYERSQAPLIYLLYIRRLAEQGHKELSVRICRDLISQYTAKHEIQVSCAALDLLVDLIGKEAADDLLKVMENPRIELRKKALDLALEIHGADTNKRWLLKMNQVSPEIQAEILIMLGQTQDQSLIPVFREMIHSQHLILRMAAVIPYAREAGVKAVPDLFVLLQHDIQEEAQRVEQALLRFDKKQVIPFINQQFFQMPLNARRVLIKVISRKHAQECADLVISQTQSCDEDLRRAALIGLENVVNTDHTLTLIHLLKTTDDKREIVLIQNALKKAFRSAEDPEKKTDEMLDAFKDAEEENKMRFLRPLSAIGGKKALDAVLNAFQNSEPRVSLEAFYALTEWRKQEAAPELLRIGRSAEDKKLRYLALRSYIRLVTSSEQKGAEKLEMLLEAKNIPQETDEYRLFISGLSQISSVDSMKEAALFFDNDELRPDAARALIHIALPQPLHKGLSGEEVISLLKKAMEIIENDYEKERISEYIKKIKK